MTPQAARELVLAALVEVAPDIDASSVVDDIPLQEQLDLDSMDFLALLGAVAEQTGLEIPERDYPQLSTLGDAAGYLVAHTGS